MPNTRPVMNEAPEYYWRYIHLVPHENVRSALESQHRAMQAFFRTISEERSGHRYAAGKWSIRQVVGHLNDCERLFVYRALWFARGLESALPSFDQEIASQHDASETRAWSSLVDEFDHLRLSTISFFRDLPVGAWSRVGIASGGTFTVRALAYITAGHVTHHAQILRDRYLEATPTA
jgi:hypothetical protein